MDDTGMDWGEQCTAIYRHLIVYTERTWPSTRAWSVLSRWEELEPVEQKALVDAMCVLGLSWGWYRVVCVILITFHGCARPGEVLIAPRSFLVLPEDLGAEPGSPCFLKVSKPKPGRRGMGRVQHCKIRDRNVSLFLSRLLLRVSFSELLYPGSGIVLFDTDGTTCSELYLYPVLLV